MEGIGVLGGVHRFGHGGRRNMFGQGELNQDAVDPVVGIEVRDQPEQRVLGSGLGEQVLGRIHPNPCAGAFFTLDVGAAGGIIPDQDDSQARRPAPGGHKLGDGLAEFRADFVRQGQAVKDLGVNGRGFSFAHWRTPEGVGGGGRYGVTRSGLKGPPREAEYTGRTACAE